LLPDMQKEKGKTCHQVSPTLAPFLNKVGPWNTTKTSYDPPNAPTRKGPE